MVKVRMGIEEFQSSPVETPVGPAQGFPPENRQFAIIHSSIIILNSTMVFSELSVVKKPLPTVPANPRAVCASLDF